MDTSPQDDELNVPIVDVLKPGHLTKKNQLGNTSQRSREDTSTVKRPETLTRKAILQ